MANKNYLRGRRLEYKIKHDYEREGWTVMRTAGSHGPYDLIAIRVISGKVNIHLIQCKAVGRSTIKRKQALLNTFKMDSPISITHRDAIVSSWLAVKETGDSDFEMYSIDEETV